MANKKKNVALVLSSGGARGLAHIGVIDELISQGYSITSIAGTSMGALVGGLYAAGTLDKFRDWVITLDKVDVLRMIDFTINSKGLIKGERVFDKMHKLNLIPDIKIENLSIPYAAIATDIIKNEEIVFNSGDLEHAIRSSIAIPNVFTPVENGSSLLVDGGVLNPLPVNRVIRSKNDLLIAVDINSIIAYDKPDIPAKKKKEKIYNEKIDALIKKWDEFFGHHHLDNLNSTPANMDVIGNEPKLGYFDILLRSAQLMQYKLSEYAMALSPPDVLINISKNSCSIFEFYKAKEMIQYGQESCRKALKEANL